MEPDQAGCSNYCSGVGKALWALRKLKDYEETGLMPDKVLELNEETQEQARAMLKRVARLSDEIERMKGEER